MLDQTSLYKVSGQKKTTLNPKMLMKTILIIFVAIILCDAENNTYVFTARQPKNEKIEETESKTVTDVKTFDRDNVNKFQQNMRKFAAAMYNKISQETGADENIFFSPLSIAHAIAMLNSGARGDTAKEIKQALRIRLDKTNAYVDSLMQFITKDIFESKSDDVVKTVMAAKSFYVPEYEMKETYIASLEKYYYSGMEEMDFSPADEAATKINKWIADRTNDLIKDLITTDMFTPLTRMVIVNALYFKGPWMKGFEMAYSPHTFFAPSSNVSAMYMLREGDYKCHKTESSVQISIPYNDTKTEFVIIMPESKAAMKAFTEKSNLTEYFKILKKRMRNWDSTKIRLIMPPFEIEKKTNVKTVLQTMGVKDLFNDLKANLSGMSDEFVFVSDFRHKAKITVDKDGTEAAAASAGSVTQRTGLRVPVVFINKPFIFAVVQDGNILFMGRVANPAA